MALVPTQVDVAQLAGVSRALVSMALADSPRVAPETKERIRAAATELGYVRNLGAAALAANRSPIVGVLLPDLRNPFFEDIVESLQRNAEPRGLVALIATAANDRRREHQAIQRFQELRASGVVLVSPAASSRTLREYSKQMAIATIGLRPSGGMVDAVHIDEQVAAGIVVGHLRGRGIDSLIHLSVSDPGRDRSVSDRRAATAQVALAAGLSFDGVQSIDQAVCMARTRLSGNPAISVHNDLTAIELVSALRRAGLTPGSDVLVTGFDDTYLAALPEFALTSVSQEPDALGRAALDLILRRLAGPGRAGEDVVVAPRLTARSTA
jgi:DNA-binding LacI/PurR family transcriptional regulator